MVGLLWWDCCGIAVGLLWDCSGIAVRLLWDCCGIAVGLLWDCCGIDVGLLWDCCGIAVGLLWDCRGIDFRVDFEVFFNKLCIQLLRTRKALGHCCCFIFQCKISIKRGRLLWDCCGIAVASLWDCCGIAVGLL